MPYHDLGTPSQLAVTHHNALCLVPDSDSAQLPVSDLLSRQLIFDLFFSENSSPSNLHVSIIIISMEDVGK